MAKVIKTITSNYTVLDSDDGGIIIGNSSSPIVITLPDAVGRATFSLEVINAGTSTVTTAGKALNQNEGMVIANSNNVWTYSASGSSSGGSSTLEGLSDVSLSFPINNQVLTYNGTNWVNQNSQGGGGGGGITDITHADLVTAIGSSALNPGSYYRITDFATVHRIVDGTGSALKPRSGLYIQGTSGSISISINGFTQTMTFSNNLFETITNFCVANQTYYADNGINIYSYADSSNNKDPGCAFFVAENTVDNTDLFFNITNNITGDLHGYSYTIIKASDTYRNNFTTEPLIVLAIASNKISNRVYSDIYPQDIILYDYKNSNWNLITDFYIDSNTPMSGLKGVIYYREDTSQRIICGYDFRGVKFRRWNTIQGIRDWDSNVTYEKGDWVRLGGYSYISLFSNNLNNSPSSYIGIIWLAMGGDNIDILPIDSDVIGATYSSNFIDYYTFNGPASYANFVDITFEPTSQYLSEPSFLPNNVFIGNAGYKMLYFGKYSWNNTFTGGWNNNIRCEGSFYNNIMGYYFQNCYFADDCYDNFFGGNFEKNNFMEECYGNHFANSFQNNSVHSSFIGNWIATACQNNTFLKGFSGNENIKWQFHNNTISTFVLNQVFTNATHVYQDYECNITNNQSGALKLTYINSSDALTIVDATS